MKAIVQNSYGSPDVLSLAEFALPVMKDNEVLVQIKASFHQCRGCVCLTRQVHGRSVLYAGFPKPKNFILGSDMSGVVEAVGVKRNTIPPW